MSSLDELVDTIDEQRKVAKKLARDRLIPAIKESLAPYFEKHKDISVIAWVQYTPYFNDGNACVFGFNGLVCFTAEDVAEDGIDSYEDGSRTSKDARSDLFQISNSIGELEDLLLMAFGDHQKITVTRDGQIKTVTYDHD